MEDTKVKSGSHSIDAGVGVRINNDEKTGFAYSDAMTNEGMLQAVVTASSIANSQKKVAPIKIQAVERPDIYTQSDVLTGIDNAEILALLNQMDVMARKVDPRVSKVICSLSTAQEYVLVAPYN